MGFVLVSFLLSLTLYVFQQVVSWGFTGGVQQLRFHASLQRVEVGSLVKELKIHMLRITTKGKELRLSHVFISLFFYFPIWDI